MSSFIGSYPGVITPLGSLDPASSVTRELGPADGVCSPWEFWAGRNRWTRRLPCGYFRINGVNNTLTALVHAESVRDGELHVDPLHLHGQN